MLRLYITFPSTTQKIVTLLRKTIAALFPKRCLCWPVFPEKRERLPKGRTVTIECVCLCFCVKMGNGVNVTPTPQTPNSPNLYPSHPVFTKYEGQSHCKQRIATANHNCSNRSKKAMTLTDCWGIALIRTWKLKWKRAYSLCKEPVECTGPSGSRIKSLLSQSRTTEGRGVITLIFKSDPGPDRGDYVGCRGQTWVA